MPLINPYCTLTEVQRDTGNSDADLVDQFEDSINLASRWIDEYTHTDFLTKDYSVTPYVVSLKDIIKDKVFVPWPIITLTKITAAGVTILADEYIFNVNERDIRRRSGEAWVSKTNYPTSTGYAEPIELTGTFGWAEPPAAVRIACIQIASVLTHEKRRERVGMDGGRTSVLDENIPKEAKEYLKRFKRLVC